jgi:anti-sigma B factor antagonist
VAEGSPAVAPLSIVTIRPSPDTVQVHIAGEIDLATAGQLRVALRAVVAAAAPSTEVRVDLSGVTFLDAIGIGVLVTASAAARDAGVDFAAHSPQGIVKRIIELLGVVELLGIAKT